MIITKGLNRRPLIKNLQKRKTNGVLCQFCLLFLLFFAPWQVLSLAE